MSVGRAPVHHVRFAHECPRQEADWHFPAGARRRREIVVSRRGRALGVSGRGCSTWPRRTRTWGHRRRRDGRALAGRIVHRGHRRGAADLACRPGVFSGSPTAPTCPATPLRNQHRKRRPVRAGLRPGPGGETPVPAREGGRGPGELRGPGPARGGSATRHAERPGGRRLIACEVFTPAGTRRRSRRTSTTPSAGRIGPEEDLLLRGGRRPVGPGLAYQREYGTPDTPPTSWPRSAAGTSSSPARLARAVDGGTRL